MNLRRLVTAATLAAATQLAAPAPASADWLLTPFLGATFGGDAAKEELSFGGSASFMGGGVLGLELDGAISPRFFDSVSSSIGDSNVTTLMGNLIVGAPLGTPGVRPYVSGGIGLIRARASGIEDLFDLTENSFGVNAGAGMFLFLANNVGVRGDLRYFRNLRDTSAGDNLVVALGQFEFWRATVGVTFRF